MNCFSYFAFIDVSDFLTKELPQKRVEIQRVPILIEEAAIISCFEYGLAASREQQVRELEIDGWR